MPISSPTTERFWIGEALIDPLTGHVTRGAESVTLEGQHLRVLLLLVERAGEVLYYDEIEQRVWSNSPAARESLYRAISHLRRALSNSPQTTQHIKTVARRGYQLTATVRLEATVTASPLETAPWQIVQQSNGRSWHGTVWSICSVIVLASILAWLGLSHREQSAAAAREQAQAEQLTSFMVGSFEEPSGSANQGSTAAQLLSQSEQRLPIDLAQQPLLQARMLEVIGMTYRRQAAYEQALPVLLRARDLYSQFDPTKRLDHTLVNSELGRVTRELGLIDDASRYFTVAANDMRAADRTRSREYADMLLGEALLEVWRGQPTEGLRKANQSLRVMYDIEGDNSSGAADVLGPISLLYLWLDDYEAAERAGRRALAIYQNNFPRQHPDRIMAEHQLAATLRLKGELREAEELLQSSLASRKQLFGNSGVMVSESLQGLAELRMMQQRWNEAEELLRQAMIAYTTFVRRDTQQLAYLQTTLAVALLRQKRAVEAGLLLTRAIAIGDATVPRNVQYVASAEHFLGEALLEQKSLIAAEQALLAAQAHWREAQAPRWRVARTRSVLGEVMVRSGRRAAGSRLIIESYREMASDVRADAIATAQAAVRLQRVLGVSPPETATGFLIGTGLH